MEEHTTVPMLPNEKGPKPSAAEVEEQRGAAAVEAFAQDREGLTDADEKDALDWLLGSKPAAQFDVVIQFDTPAGPLPLTFTLAAQDGRKLEKIDQRHVSETTGMLDEIGAACEIVAEATVGVSGRPGHSIDLRSPEFLTMRVLNRETGEEQDHRFASPAEAIEQRFRTQLGLVQGAANRVRKVSGYDVSRVGDPKRRVQPLRLENDPLTHAAGNS